MKRIFYLIHVVALATLIGWSVQGLAQSELDAGPPQVVVTNVQGNRAYLEIRANQLQAAINELYNLCVGAANSDWAAILENGSDPGMDVNYSGYDILGVGSFGADGTLSADSLILTKDGVIQGSLTLQSGLHVGSIFALDQDVVLDLDGAGLLKVDGKGLFTDSLTVNGHAAIGGTLFADSIAVTDVINGRVSSLSNHDTDDLTEGTTNLYFTESRAQDAFTAGTGVTLNGGEISIGQAVGTTDDVTFDGITANSLTVNGATTLGPLDVYELNAFGDSDFNHEVSVHGLTWLHGALDVSGRAKFFNNVNFVDTTTLASTLDVYGVTTLNDSLVVGSGVNVAATLWADSISVTDVINGQVDDISNHDTDGLTEGTSNLYFTDARAIAALADTIAYLIGRIEALQPVAESFTCGESFTYDGYTYETVQIGTQCWFAENLQTTVYADGTEIPLEGAGQGWASLATGARSALDDNPNNVSVSGYLYNGYAVLNAAGICPSGWHVPSQDEWSALLAEVSDNASLLKSPTDWDGVEEGNSGLSVIPGGARSGSIFWNTGNYYDQTKANFWSSTEDGSSLVYYIIEPANNTVSSNAAGPSFGWSVRCVLDDAAD